MYFYSCAVVVCHDFFSFPLSWQEKRNADQQKLALDKPPSLLAVSFICVFGDIVMKDCLGQMCSPGVMVLHSHMIPGEAFSWALVLVKFTTSW